MALFSPPTLTSPLARSRLGAAASPVTSAGLGSQYSVPGTNATGTRGSTPIVNRTSPYTEKRDPLVAYQDTLKRKIDQGRAFTNSVVTSYANKRKAAVAAPSTQTGRKIKYAQPKSGAYVAPGNGGKVGWGGYTNGNIPAGAMQRISFAPNAMLERNAANSFEQLNAAYRQAFGSNIAVTDSYRSLAGQYAVAKSKGKLAAKPGTSVHGYGKALDLGGGINKGGSRQNQWMQQNAPRFGFVNPNWAKTTKIEPWHWEYQR